MRFENYNGVSTCYRTYIIFPLGGYIYLCLGKAKPWWASLTPRQKRKVSRHVIRASYGNAARIMLAPTNN